MINAQSPPFDDICVRSPADRGAPVGLLDRPALGVGGRYPHQVGDGDGPRLQAVAVRVLRRPHLAGPPGRQRVATAAVHPAAVPPRADGGSPRTRQARHRLVVAAVVAAVVRRADDDGANPGMETRPAEVLRTRIAVAAATAARVLIDGTRRARGRTYAVLILPCLHGHGASQGTEAAGREDGRCPAPLLAALRQAAGKGVRTPARHRVLQHGEHQVDCLMCWCDVTRGTRTDVCMRRVRCI